MSDGVLFGGGHCAPVGRVGEDLNLVLVVIAFFFGLDRERDLELELDDNPLYDVLDLVGVRDRERSTGPAAILKLYFMAGFM